MSVDEFGSFREGGVTYPLTSSTSNSLLQDADPALFTAIEFFRSVLTTHIGPRLLAEAERLHLALLGAVAYTTNIDPGKHPIDTRYRFPLLAVYRQKTKRAYRTLNWAQAASTWGVSYLLPVLSTVQAETLEPILKAVGDVLDNRIEQGFDPGYNAGQRVWAACGIEEISFDSDEYGLFSVPDGAQFFAGWTGVFMVKEITRPSDFGPLTGVDASLDLTTAGDETITDYVAFKDDVPKVGPATG